jgi:hypothetical protein
VRFEWCKFGRVAVVIGDVAVVWKKVKNFF